MSGIYREGIGQAIAKLEDPERIKHHDPAVLFRKIGLRRGMRLADLGCGTGFFAIPAAKIVDQAGYVFAVDNVPEALVVLKSKLKDAKIQNVETIQADLSSTGIGSRSVDVVLMANVFHDVRKRCLNEVRRILRPSGKFVVLDWKKVAMQHGPPVELRLSPDEANSIIEDGGFRVRHRFEIGPYHYVLPAERDHLGPEVRESQ